MINLNRRAVAWVSVIVLAIAASITSITNQFAYDDRHIILLNGSVHTLSRWWELFGASYWPPEIGGDLYRPFAILVFAIEWAIGGGSPLVFHLANILLYAAVCGALLWVALSILPLEAAWLAAALFAVHPLHVEVVGNAVGQSELWVALFMFLALGIYIRARKRGPELSLGTTCIIAALFAFACLTKEHALVLPLLLLAAELTVVPRTLPLRARAVAVRPLVLLLAAVGLAFLWARMTVLGGSSADGAQMTLIFVDQPFSIRAMTMLRVTIEWIRLFFWPAHLSADYSPRQIEIVTGPTVEMIPSALIIVAGGILAWRARHAAPAGTFAVLWVAAALIIPSNLIIPTGFVLAERTLFLASAGITLGVAAVALYLSRFGAAGFQRPNNLVLGAIATVLVLGVVASAARQPVWRDNDTLFAQSVKDAPLSYKSRLSYSASLFEQRKLREGFEQLNIAYNLYPDDVALIEFAGQQYAQARSCGVAVRLFRMVLEKQPLRDPSRLGLASCLIMMGNHDEAQAVIRKGLAIGQQQKPLRQLLRINDSVEVVRHPRASAAPAASGE